MENINADNNTVNKNGFARAPQWHRHFGCTFSTDKENFGETISVFPVPPGWDGYRYHGYGWASREDVLSHYGNKGAAMRHFKARIVDAA